MPFHHLLHFWDRVRCTHNRGGMRRRAGGPLGGGWGRTWIRCSGNSDSKKGGDGGGVSTPFSRVCASVYVCVTVCVCMCTRIRAQKAVSLSLSLSPTPANCPPHPLSRSRAGRMTAGVHGCVDYDRHSHTCTGAWRGADWYLFTRETKGREL